MTPKLLLTFPLPSLPVVIAEVFLMIPLLGPVAQVSIILLIIRGKALVVTLGPPPQFGKEIYLLSLKAPRDNWNS